MERRCAHHFSSLSPEDFVSALSGVSEIKPATVIRNQGLCVSLLILCLWKCLTTLVSLLCSTSLKCPWKLFFFFLVGVFFYRFSSALHCWSST